MDQSQNTPERDGAWWFETVGFPVAWVAIGVAIGTLLSVETATKAEPERDHGQLDFQTRLAEVWRTIAESNAKLMHVNNLRADVAEQQRDQLMLILDRCHCEAEPKKP